MTPPILGDTAPAQRKKYFDLLAKMTPAQRLVGAARLSSFVRTVGKAGIRHRHPDADERQQKVLLCALLYGPEATRRLFGVVPPDGR